MNLPNELKFLEKPIQIFVFEPNWISLGRIALWLAAFLMLFHLLAPKIESQLPYQKEMSEQNLVPLSSATSDPRWSRPDLQKLPENSIAWIAGSSIAIKSGRNNSYTFLPAQIDTTAQQYVSLKMARRMLDTYTMVKDSIDRKPAAMVVVINPFWELNDKASFFKTNLMNKGASLWLSRQDFFLIPLTAPIGSRLWMAAGQHHNLISNGYDYLKIIQPPKPQKIKKENTKPKLNYKQPALFWIVNRDHEQRSFDNFDATAWQEAIMKWNNIEQSNWGKKMFIQMLDNIQDSNIPTLIYLAPVSPELEKSEARAAYRTVKGQIEEIAKDYRTENIRIITHTPDNITKTMQFTDHLHLSNSGKFPSFLNKEISDMIETQ